ncbi:ribosome-inactivating family protein [Streptomyces sp. SP18CS02]|uniref:ribosome-inactivating family protein n=1 Tax=Streptomyces sp. SP18CS02 TaxID=3002531 RepID=UPI002E795426|nr:ribosome-inactivating family protein [Streptomyces sp. SP18CS02]MEE1755302.1 ribosome-inactivating family protein [Streptomyces sp. SP18CS02]
MPAYAAATKTSNTAEAYSPVTAANSYDGMLAPLREIVGTMPPYHGATFSLTTRRTDSYVEVALMDYSETVPHRLSVIVNANNLYTEGFFTPHDRYLCRGRDMNPILSAYNSVHGGLQASHLTYLPFGENYNQFSRDEWRQNQSFLSLRGDINYLVNLYGVIGQNTPPATQAGMSLTQVIAAVSEAARFGWIQNRILNTTRSGSDIDGANRYSHLGGLGAEMEASWAALTHLLADSAADRPTMPVTVNNRTYRTAQEIEYGDSGRHMPAIDVNVGLGSQYR